MTVRVGKGINDLKATVALLHHACSRSIYAKMGGVNEKYATELFARAAWFHGQYEAGGMFWLVSEVDGKIEGFFLGQLAPVYHVGTKLEAQDIYLYTTGRAGPLDAVIMLRAFWKWAEACPEVIEITGSNSDFIPGNKEKLGRFLLSSGFVETNSVYKRRIAR
jgi:hypothetical protein